MQCPSVFVERSLYKLGLSKLRQLPSCLEKFVDKIGFVTAETNPVMDNVLKCQN